MPKKTLWEPGKVYRTKGRLCAQILQINRLAIPKGLSPEETQRLKNKPFYGIEGYVFLESEPHVRIRGSWTLLGKHTWENPGVDVGDLTDEELPQFEKKRLNVGG